MPPVAFASLGFVATTSGSNAVASANVDAKATNSRTKPVLLFILFTPQSKLHSIGNGYMYQTYLKLWEKIQSILGIFGDLGDLPHYQKEYKNKVQRRNAERKNPNN